MENYASIANRIVKIQPVGWSKVVLYAQISEESYEIFFYTKVGDKYLKNYELEKTLNVSREDFRQIFKKIYEELLPDYKEKRWYVFTMTVQKTGKFVVNYEYHDCSEDSLKYKSDWKKKYLD